MKILFTTAILMTCSLSLGATNALVCNDGNEITKAEILTISQAKYELNYQFNEIQTEEELLKQVSERFDEVSPLLGQMFANVYLDVTKDENLNLGSFAFPAPEQTQTYRICDNTANLPELVTIAKQEKKLKIDEVLYNKLNPTNKMALILEEVLRRLNTKDIKQLTADLLTDKKTNSLNVLLEDLYKNKIKNRITNNYEARVKHYANAGSYEDAQQVISNSTVKLDHGVSVQVVIDKKELIPYELAKLQNLGTPHEWDHLFWGIPGGFITSAAINGIGNPAIIIFSGGALALSPAAGIAIIATGVTLGTAYTAYGIIQNTIYKRKRQLLTQAHNLVYFGQKYRSRLLDRFYRQFKRKISDVTKLEYAQRIIDLAYENAFGNKRNGFVGALKMKQIIIESFN